MSYLRGVASWMIVTVLALQPHLGCSGEDTCDGGLTSCGSTCADITRDSLNCGACGAECASGESCDDGSCVVACFGGTTKCGDQCVDTALDDAHCGECDSPCDDGQACVDGQCALDCFGGTTKCGDQCVDTALDNDHCGGCDSPCDDGLVCSQGQCGLVCAGGTSLCGEQCVDTLVDANHCGECDLACEPTDVCNGGTCECPNTFTNCNDLCVNLDTDSANCGRCGNDCFATGQYCSAGVCCDSGAENCGGTCVDTQTDLNNCGVCTMVCGAQELCLAGECSAAPPVVSIDTDPVNCTFALDHETATGDDRGGIAVAGGFVYYNGDNQVGRFDKDTLGNGTALASINDAMVSDPFSGKLYALGTGAATFHDDGGKSPIFTHLHSLDPNDGTIMATMMLSQTVQPGAGGNHGIFGGANFMILFDEDTDESFHIDFATGDVTSLGTNAHPTHADCEEWAFWGWAETDGTDFFIVYVRSTTQIARMNVSTGVEEILATTTGLSDMCSITLDGIAGRWISHFEGVATQFNQGASGEESLSSCPVTF